MNKEGERRNPYRTYSDGRPKVPHLGSYCDPERGTVDHRICGGWWCVCSCHDDDLGESDNLVADHLGHQWEQVDRCVYCCGRRLYQGSPPADSVEQEALAAMFDAISRRARKEWAYMRGQVNEHIRQRLLDSAALSGEGEP